MSCVIFGKFPSAAPPVALLLVGRSMPSLPRSSFTSPARMPACGGFTSDAMLPVHVHPAPSSPWTSFPPGPSSRTLFATVIVSGFKVRPAPPRPHAASRYGPAESTTVLNALNPRVLQGDALDDEPFAVDRETRFARKNEFAGIGRFERDWFFRRALPAERERLVLPGRIRQQHHVARFEAVRQRRKITGREETIGRLCVERRDHGKQGAGGDKRLHGAGHSSANRSIASSDRVGSECPLVGRSQSGVATSVSEWRSVHSLTLVATKTATAYFQATLKNPASAIAPGQRGPGASRRSMMAKSGSFGVCKEFVP